MFADGSHYDSRSLAAGFFCQQPAHDCSVLVIQMADGSSRKMKSKGWQRLRIKATLCCWPKDSFPAFSFTLSAMPIASNRVRTSFLFLKLVSRFFSCMFSMAVSSGKIRNS